MSVPGVQKIHWYSVLQFALSVLAIFGLWVAAAGLTGLGFIELLGQTSAMTEILPMFMMGAGLVFSGFLLLPSAVLALARLIGRPALFAGLPRISIRPTLLILPLPLVLVIGQFAAQRAGNIPMLGVWLLPFMHLLAVGLPVSWLLYLAGRDLQIGSAQRSWGVFGSGLVFGPAVILAAETISLAVFVIAAAIYITSQSELANELSELVQMLTITEPDPEQVMALLSPYLTRPGVIFSVLLFGSVLVPLIEELIKPIGVWLLVGSRLTPAQGFAAGALSGAGYALFESLALSASTEEWVFLVVARIGTAVIHILTTGLMGWAMALAWEKRQYWRLGLTYLTAITIHGLWNGLTLLTTFTSLADVQNAPALPSLIINLGNTAPLALMALTAGAFSLLLISNRALYRAGLVQKEPAMGIPSLDEPVIIQPGVGNGTD